MGVLQDFANAQAVNDALKKGVQGYDKAVKNETDILSLGKKIDGLTLGLHTDGLFYIFINGEPVGNGISLPKSSGDVYGNVDSGNNIILNGDLADGEYFIKYEMADGSTIDIGELVLDTTVADPVTIDVELIDGIRIGSDGTEKTQAGYCATENIDLTNIPKPCTINLTKAFWCTTGSDTMVRVYAQKADSTKLVADMTKVGVGDNYFTIADNSGGAGNDVTVTITSNDVGYIRFSGWWAKTGVSDSVVSFIDANTKATLTYTPTV